MNSVDVFIILVIYLGLLISTGVFYNLYKIEKRKHQDAIDMWQLEKNAKVKRIEYLEQQLEEAKSWERVIKIEQVHLQPRELECKFMLHERFVDDTELFKKVITSEVARYMAEELNKDPCLCKVYHDVSNVLSNNDAQEYIKVRFRMLPYAEGVVLDDLFMKEEE